MKVLVPYAGDKWPLQAVRLALRQDGIDASFCEMKDDESYFSLLSALWLKKETFSVVEHDIVTYPGAIDSLNTCKELWCTIPYYCSVGWIEDGLGCTKFDGRLMLRYPDFFKEPFSGCCAHNRHYCSLDRLIAHRMRELGIKPHVHTPGVTNLNERWT